MLLIPCERLRDLVEPPDLRDSIWIPLVATTRYPAGANNPKQSRYPLISAD